MNRLDCVKYDERATLDQEDFKHCFSVLIEKIEKQLVSPRAKALAITKLEESYMWVGKAIRDDQIDRNGFTELQEEKKDG